jgi:hypothetical protein
MSNVKRFFDRSKDLNPLQRKALQLKQDQLKCTALDLRCTVKAFGIAGRSQADRFESLEEVNLRPGYYTIIDYLAVQIADLSNGSTKPSFVYFIWNAEQLCMIEQSEIDSKNRLKPV